MKIKICTKCNTPHPATLEFFHSCRGTKDGLYSQCKKCKKAAKKIWKQTPAGRAAKKRERYRWKQTPAGRAAKKRERDRWKKRPAGIAQRKKYSKKPHVKVRKNCSKRLKAFLQASGVQKDRSSSKYFDFTPRQLTTHLESQFTPEMDWDNYGTYWHIDHIVPLAYYGIESAEDPKIKEAWKLDNLRPLEASLNVAKSSFYEGTYHFYKK